MRYALRDRAAGSAWSQVRVVVAVSERASAVTGAGDRGPVARHGGIRVVAEASGVSATTVRRGVAELESGEDSLPVGRARRAGGGRKRVDQHDPELTRVLLGLVEPDERGDPM